MKISCTRHLIQYFHAYCLSLRHTNGEVPIFYWRRTDSLAWWDYFDEKNPGKTKSITIDVGNVDSVKVIETIPNAEWGKDLKDKDYPKFFNTDVKKVSNGKVSFDLKEKPVFVEIEGKAII
jgi:hypothetical protein